MQEEPNNIMTDARIFDEDKIIKSVIPTDVMTFYPGYNTDLELSDAERLIVEHARQLKNTLYTVDEEEFDQVSDEEDDVLICEPSPPPETEVQVYQPEVPQYTQPEVPVTKPEPLSGIAEQFIVSGTCFTKDNVSVRNINMQTVVSSNPMNFFTEDIQHKTRSTDDYKTKPTPRIDDEMTKDQQIKHLSQKVSELEKHKTSSAKRILTMLKGIKKKPKSKLNLQHRQGLSKKSYKLRLINVL